jgi:hypothetical protein
MDMFWFLKLEAANCKAVKWDAASTIPQEYLFVSEATELWNRKPFLLRVLFGVS